MNAQADVSDPVSVKTMWDNVESAFGAVDVLVNNAGIMRLAKVAESDDALIDSQIAINLKGSLYLMREAANRLRDGGRVINFSSSVIGLHLPTTAYTSQRRQRSRVSPRCSHRKCADGASRSMR